MLFVLRQTILGVDMEGKQTCFYCAKCCSKDCAHFFFSHPAVHLFKHFIVPISHIAANWILFKNLIGLVLCE